MKVLYFLKARYNKEKKKKKKKKKKIKFFYKKIKKKKKKKKKTITICHELRLIYGKSCFVLKFLFIFKININNIHNK